ncbi:MAG TPA: hypothetical protein VFS41_04085 [Edaphobacter sp.]|nr:hypothetical protein [Edaphobacter sp.]
MHDAPPLDILLLVHILFVISIASLLVVLGAAAAIVHHVRNDRHRIAQAPPEPSFADHLQAATEYGTPRSTRVVPAQSVQSIGLRKDWAHDTKQNTVGEASASGGRPGPQLIHKSPVETDRQKTSETDTIQTAAAPRLRILAAGDRIVTKKNT